MSFPPHLNPIPQLPPGISATQFAGFPTTVPTTSPIIPMHVGMMPPSPAVLVTTTVPLAQKPMGQTREAFATRTKEPDEGTGAITGPTTTVFVGDISEKASDMLVRQLLAKCGLVLSWKRVQGASGKLQAFGFCEYKEPESTLRALRLLHGLQVADKKLLVKVDAKTKAQLDTWKANQKRPNGAHLSGEDATDEEVLDEETKRCDQMVKGAIDGLIREYSSELTASSQDAEAHQRKKRREKKENDINAMEMEDDKRDLISREISKFRDTHKKLEEEKERDRQQTETERRDRDKEREREKERRDREREKERERERQKERDKERERDRDRERTKEKEREKERSRDQSTDRSRSRERSREEKKKVQEEDEEEAYERRKLERKLREKEAAYQERLKNWEIRERKKSRDYSKEEEREEERHREMTKEAKRLKEFLEDYDDDRDDPKYYRGSALQKRLRDREQELELDERNRKREKDELEEIRQRLLAEGHPDPDAELQRIEQEAVRERQPSLKQEQSEEVLHISCEEPQRKGCAEQEAYSDNNVSDREEDEDEDDDREDKPSLKPTLRPITTASSVSSASGSATPLTPGSESPHCVNTLHENSSHEAPPTEEQRPKIGLSLKLGAAGSPKMPQAVRRKALAAVDSVFNKSDDEEAEEAPKKRKLVPLDYNEDERGGLSLDGAEVTASRPGFNTEEKQKYIKSLIEKIPTVKQELFNYPLDWNMVDSTLMDRRIRPWINKKIIEYIGEEEATLVDYVCSKVMAHSTPEGILDDVAMVLDEEAEVFIVKMWRLLIYETEAKKTGLVK
ncbi:RNA-binding protein 25-like [Myxocyprinus asiaticus]|uniref:RNA-binding protein 25-like n=1 Tax=Myxocyprinus asiaticus TaxID=70543 RepID=UPI0022221651|nr:RNA-binding protein 25-like [Myxocyprinus asiaticus]XP_051507555.1 RNA-binding protein 25-like [Myxocyprinus asiaticus]